MALSGLDGAAPADEGEADACSAAGDGGGRPSKSREAGIDTDRADARVLASSHMARVVSAVEGQRGGREEWRARATDSTPDRREATGRDSASQPPHNHKLEWRRERRRDQSTAQSDRAHAAEHRKVVGTAQIRMCAAAGRGPRRAERRTTRANEPDRRLRFASRISSECPQRTNVGPRSTIPACHSIETCTGLSILGAAATGD